MVQKCGDMDREGNLWTYRTLVHRLKGQRKKYGHLICVFYILRSWSKDVIVLYRRLLMPKIEKFKEIIRRQCRQAQQDEKLEFWLLKWKILRLLLLLTKFNFTRNRDRGTGTGTGAGIGSSRNREAGNADICYLSLSLFLLFYDGWPYVIIQARAQGYPWNPNKQWNSWSWTHWLAPFRT